MPFLRYFKRLQYIDFMVRRRATGDLDTFAKRNRLSKSALSEVLNEMRQMGFPLKFDRSKKTYYYEHDGEMINCLFLKYGQVLTRDETKAVRPTDSLCFSPSALFEVCGEH